MALQSLPSSAAEYAVDQRAEIAAAISALRRLWRRMGNDFDASWALVGPQVLEVLDAAQERITVQALDYLPAVLAETGQRVREAEYALASDALVGTAGDGLPTESLAYGAVVRAKARVAEGVGVTQALRAGGDFLSLAASTALSDTGRTAEKVAGHSRRVAWYVRMLNPPSCGRCLVLAGRRTTSTTAFERHPGCDCRNIPSSEATDDDRTVNAAEYLDGLDDKELARALGSRANARAYQDGASLDQLINAYRRAGSVRPAQVYDGRIKYTTEGATKRGLAYRAMAAADRSRGALNVRLMPETIYQRAGSREEALQMLRDYGWIQPERPGFVLRDGAFIRVR